MAGMEVIEIHNKNYLVRWVNAKSDHTISWTIQPHKKSINFGLFKHPGHLGGLAHLPSVGGLPHLSLHSHRQDESKDEATPEVVEKLTSIGLKEVVKLGKCEADKSTQGKYEVPAGEFGNYALVFDNTFSKTVSKTVTIFLLTYPTNCQTQIHFGAQVHHSQAMASAMALAPPLTSRKSPKLRARNKDSADSLRVSSMGQIPTLSSIPIQETPTSEETSTLHTGVLQKRRRKKHQGYARRFFCLDYTSSTLSYYHDKNSSALRGAIPLSLAAIGANARTREISIDSGAEIWHLKASNKPDFDEWKKALEKASRIMAAATTPGNDVNLQTDLQGPGQSISASEKDLARLEAVMKKIADIRDSIRRICTDTLSNTGSTPSPTPDWSLNAPENGSDDYFKANERKPFWKRKPSSPGVNPTVFKRSISSQLASAAEGTATTNITSHTTSGTLQNQTSHDEGLNDHMRALAIDLDRVIHELSTVVVENRRGRHVPKSHMSRMSMHSIDSQEFFDAEDRRPQILDIPDESDVEEEKIEVDSEDSSDVDEGYFKTGTRGARSGSLLPPKPKSLIPLPHQPVKRRNIVNAPTIMPPSLIGFLRKNVGKDLSTISMPVSANEPLSLLQRAAEGLEYSTLLDKAAKSTDPDERLMYVAGFVISHLSNSRIKDRSIRKPFNPMLGETYELVREDLNFRFIAEKVSHRPVQLAYHAESSEWSYAQSPLPSQKFWGKSSEIITEGKARLVLHTPGECYTWSAPTCFLRNIIAGEKYVEPVGTLSILNETTGAKAVAKFKAGGMFSGRSEEVDVQLFDGSGTELPIGLGGTWTQSLCLKEDGKTNTSKVVWTAGPLVQKPEKHYGMTLFAASLNEVTSLEQGKLPPTDSRLRPDQRALEDGDHEKAEALKNSLEEAQRQRRRDMEVANENWKPRWFTRIESGDEVFWRLKTGPGNYWDERTKAEWKDVMDVLRIE